MKANVLFICGVAVAQGLSYCNFCGAKLNVVADDDASKSIEAKPDLLVTAMVALFIFGLVAITILMGMMKSVLDLPVERVIAFTLPFFLILVLIEAVFIRLLFRGRRAVEKAGAGALSKEQVTNELDAARSRVLSEGMPSVTEHTTRAFAPINDERAAK